MFEFLRIVLIYLWCLLRGRHELAMEALALRHQIMVLKRQKPRPKVPFLGSLSLGDVQKRLVRVANTIDHLSATDRRGLAASRIQAVVTMEVQAAAWAACKGSGIDPTHRPDVGRQSDVG